MQWSVISKFYWTFRHVTTHSNVNIFVVGFFTGVKEGTKSLSKSIHENDNEIQFSISEDFSNIDHRVKFHLYQHIFEDEYEDFLWLLKCLLLRNGTSDAISACVVLSTQKIYTLQVKDHMSG